MSWPFRVTPPLLDVVDALTHAESKIHGWELAAKAGQSGPNTYRALERLRGAGWVDYEWEAENPEPSKPRRRFYWLTEEGWAQAQVLLAERRAPRGARQLPGLALMGLLALLGCDAR